MRYSSQVNRISNLRANSAEVLAYLAEQREHLVSMQNGEAKTVLHEVASHPYVGPYTSISNGLGLRIICRLSLRVAILIFIAAGMAACAPRVKDLNLSQQIVDDLPADYARSFLQTLSPAWNSTCQFEEDGLRRTHPPTGRLLPGKYPYSSFYAQPVTPGIMVVVKLYGPDSSQPFCSIATESNADKLGKDVKQFTGKVLTALLSIGVRLPYYFRSPVNARPPGT